MLWKGRAARIALATAAVTPATFTRSASEIVLASTTPSDLPTCAAAGEPISRTPARKTPASCCRMSVSRVDSIERHRPEAWMPVGIHQSQQTKLHHDAGRQGRGRGGLHNLPEERGAA